MTTRPPLPRLATPPSVPRFLKDFLYRRRPVVLRDLFAGQPIARIGTKQRAIASLGGMKIVLRKEYGHLLEKKRTFRSTLRTGTLRAYFTKPWSERAPWICTEQPLPREMRPLVEDLPPYCAFRYGEDEVVSQLFAGRKGLTARLHFDGDQAHVLFHQIFGRKRVALIDPAQGRLFDSMRNLSMVNVANMVESEKLRFFEYVDAQVFIVHPGETVYIPPLTWHYIEYLDDAMSMNLRFGRTAERRFFGENLLGNFYLQNLSAWMPEKGPLTPAQKRAFSQIERLWRRRPRRGWSQAYQAEMDALQRKLFEQHCDPRAPVSWLPSHAQTRLEDLYPDPKRRR